MFQKYPIGDNKNLEALRYFVHYIGDLIEGVPQVYNDTKILLDELALKKSDDPEIKKFKKLDYLSLIQFWKENTPMKYVER